jgi:hypothetical protein
MSITWSCLTVFNPLLDRSILIPSIVSGQNLNTWHIGFIEDFRLSLKELDSILGSLILVNTSLNFVEECSFLLDIIVLLDNIGMSCW